MGIRRKSNSLLMAWWFAGWIALQANSWAEETRKISSFAPAADLLQQVDFFIGRAEESLQNPADFDGAKQSRTLKDGSTLAVLALMLAHHDEPLPLKTSMPTMLAAAKALAAAGDQVEPARTALAQIKAARAGHAPSTATAKWEKAASLAALMKQVPLIHTALKRGVDPNRLARQAVQSAGQAAALAAIAEAASLDPEPAQSSEDVATWREYCAQMRDAAGEVNAAVHAKDSDRVAAGMKRMTQSCDACHAKFRSQ
jgi:cytochrome c556